jgi:hypothetical protein
VTTRIVNMIPFLASSADPVLSRQAICPECWARTAPSELVPRGRTWTHIGEIGRNGGGIWEGDARAVLDP